jgi:hypothetical protein
MNGDFLSVKTRRGAILSVEIAEISRDPTDFSPLAGPALLADQMVA